MFDWDWLRKQYGVMSKLLIKNIGHKSNKNNGFMKKQITGGNYGTELKRKNRAANGVNYER